jgi:hypothetical protein
MSFLPECPACNTVGGGHRDSCRLKAAQDRISSLKAKNADLKAKVKTAQVLIKEQFVLRMRAEARIERAHALLSTDLDEDNNTGETNMNEKTDVGETLEHLCKRLREELKLIENQTRAVKDYPEFNAAESYPGQYDEMRAQSMLAVRHIEDARMRLGKVLQYAGDGVSIYDKA